MTAYTNLRSLIDTAVDQNAGNSSVAKKTRTLIKAYFYEERKVPGRRRVANKYHAELDSILSNYIRDYRVNSSRTALRGRRLNAFSSIGSVMESLPVLEAAAPSTSSVSTEPAEPSSGSDEVRDLVSAILSSQDLSNLATNLHLIGITVDLPGEANVGIQSATENLRNIYRQLTRLQELTQ